MAHLSLKQCWEKFIEISLLWLCSHQRFSCKNWGFLNNIEYIKSTSLQTEKRVIHLTESRDRINMTEIGEHGRKIDNGER